MIVLFLLMGFFTVFYLSYDSDDGVKISRIRSTSSPKFSLEMKKVRWDYFFQMLRDPATDKIPDMIRTRELEFARELDASFQLLKQSSTSNSSWQEAGPHDVGGRTRGLAVDITNPSVILAGGVSGGVWKSTDNGATWSLKSCTNSILNVTTIAQDPRLGHTHIWYYGSGEFFGSGPDYGSVAPIFGDGIYKSTDSGETWNILPATVTPDPTAWSGEFAFVSNIKINPLNGNIFVATNGLGIFRSTDGGETFSLVLGGANNHIWSDVAIGSDGTLLAVLSRSFVGINPANKPGLYKSTDNGTTWTNITPPTYPETSMRSVLCIAPSNPNAAYMFTQTGGSVNNREEIKFYKINISAGTSEDRSQNMPDFTSLGGLAGDFGFIDTQYGYNMVVAVKPDDENMVLIGATSLFRSTDGFATKPSDARTSWIGGYHMQEFFYPDLHPDVHSFAFDPTDPKKVWWGHDGGLSYTTDITNTSYQTLFPWENKNNGYNITQFYHITISGIADDPRIMGGTQDNGTPYLRFTGSVAGSIHDVSTGDGAFAYFGRDFAYTSAQNGVVMRLRYDAEKNPRPPFQGHPFAIITPPATNQLFIHPFTVDPNDEDVMYYPAGNELWRNNQLSAIPDGVNGTSIGWTKLQNLTVPSGYIISTLSISESPQHILYYGASNRTAAPLVYRLTNATTATSGAVNISIPDAQQGAYVHDIAVNPDNADEILVVFSNYNVVSLYHSVNGGQSYTAVEGNLGGTQENPGPSFRAASILPGSGIVTYFVATSIGVFSTTQFDGNNTVWMQEGKELMGNVIVNHIVTRKSDGKVVAGTHGRGAFVGTRDAGGTAVLLVDSNELNIEVYPGQTKTTSFRINNNGSGTLSYIVSASGGESIVAKTIVPPLPRSQMAISGEMKTEFITDSAERIKIEPVGEIPPFISEPLNVSNSEELVLDDGDNFADIFLGGGAGVYFYWRNDFQTDKDFDLEKIRFLMRTETITQNPLQILVAGNDGSFIFDTTATFLLSSSGGWYEFQFPQWVLNTMRFRSGETFTLIVGAMNNNIDYPAGADLDGAKPNNSYYAYYSYIFGTWVFSGWGNLNTIISDGVFIIRAVGRPGGGTQNQNPVAVMNVSPNPALINQQVTFDGAGSYDPDGQIVSYSWEFGDGYTSNQMNATHSYSQAGQFTYRLTVTDNNGATGQSAGSIVISDTPSRWTVTPSSGTVAAGSYRDVSISFASEGLPEGNYAGQLHITSNGGNSVVPVRILISTAVKVDDRDVSVYSFRLEQNYPNPFNPSTTISWELARDEMVSLIIYDIAGKEIATLVSERLGAGKYEITFNASNLSSGVYLYRLRAGDYSETKKLVLLK
jgi:photosystem II stability/assembly factor-like uncharacterized protein